MTPEKKDPMSLFKGPKTPKIVTEIKRNHHESDLHLAYCKWLDKYKPGLIYLRHEREKARSAFMQNLFRVYNGDIDRLPDFELIELCRVHSFYDGIPIHSDIAYGLYLEFKRPGEQWTLSDGKTIKPNYAGQYKFHTEAWKRGRCAYFCNDLDIAKQITIAYLSGAPLPQQQYFFKEVVVKNDIFVERGL
jgi:hypothetical protein